MTTAAPSVGDRSLLARTVAAHGLAGSMLDFPGSPLSDREFSALLTEVRAQRLTGLLWGSIADGSLPVTEEQADRVESMHVRALSGTLVLERLLIETVTELEDAGIPVRVLKGSAAAHLDYPDPAMRTFGDIDLLVPGESFDSAVDCLTRRGHERIYPQPRPGFDRRFSKGTSFRTAEGLEIDLHRTFTMGPFGIRLDLKRLWETHEDFRLGDRRLAALSAEERFLHACYHAVLGESRPRLVPLRDAAQIALTRRLDLKRLHRLIRASKGEAVVSRAIRYAWIEFDIADVLAISAWAHTYRLNPREAADLAAYGSGSTYATKSLAAIRALPTFAERAAFVYALLVPTRSYLQPRHNGRIERLRTGVRQRQHVRGSSR